LTNAGSHFTVDVEVGTPGQKFSVVADTGSNSLIVPSCLCVQAGKCSQATRCFVGHDRSSTFHLFLAKSTRKPFEELLTFGSGQIAGVIARDTVRVGNLSTTMNDGLLLMVDKALNFNTAFEGILGLGPPQPEKEDRRQVSSMGRGDVADEGEGVDPASGISKDQIRDIVQKILGGAADAAREEGRPALTPHFGSPKAVSAAQVSRPRPGEEAPPDADAVVVEKPPRTSSFLEQAGIGRFSMCFNQGSEGVLGLGGPPKENALRSVGMYHWGLDFRGVSVGGKTQKLQFCSPEDMRPGQETPCGMIPDSGTTLLMGPEEQVIELLEAVCDQWERCSSNFTALQRAAEAADKAIVKEYGLNPWELQVPPKAAVAKLLLKDCDSWMRDSEQGLGELPTLSFHVAGAADGKAQELRLSGVDYVLRLENSSSASVCAPAFGPMDYPTQKNGPVWIMGLPLFFAYTVAYDAQAKPPTVAFTSRAEAPCGACGAKSPVGLVGASSAVVAAGSAERERLRHNPHVVRGEPRMPTTRGEL